MKHTNFTKTHLATSLSLILGAAALPAVAQDTSSPDQSLEVIEVKGLRGSLVQSMDIKRESVGVVDAITAEDMGKFPDTNLAESLQRITGVAISRSNGEGSEITVRGWGPEQNLILFNGRQMPSGLGNRSFDFANIASEGVTGVEVYKTGDAGMTTGGVGSVINILTNRPLNRVGSVSAISAKAVYDDSSILNSGFTPELSGIYSFKNDEGTFGVSVTASYQERENGNQQAQVGTGWRSFPGNVDGDWSSDLATDWGGIQPNSGQVNSPLGEDQADEIYSVPQTTIYRFEEVNRVRENAQLVLQYKPIDTLTATVDYTYFSNEVDTRHQDVSAWYNFGPSENVWTDGPIASPLLYSETYDPASPADMSMAAGLAATKDETDSIGLNVEWVVSDKLLVNIDHHSSKSEWGANGPYGTAPNFSMGAYVRTSAATDFTGELPILSVGGGNTVQPLDMRVTGRVFGNGQNLQEIDQTQIDANYIINDDVSIDFGVSKNEVLNRVQNVNVQADDWGGLGEEGDFDADWFDRETIADKFDVSGGDFSIASQLNSDANLNFFEPLNTFFWLDFASIVAQADAIYPDNSAILGDCGSSFCPSTDWAASEDRTTIEDTTALYFKVNYETDIKDMYLRANFGLRYEETKIKSTSVANTYQRARWVADTETVLSNENDEQIREFLNQTGDYDYLLPSLNVTLDVTDDMVVRVAASKTIARAGYDSLLGGTSISQTANAGGGSGSAGNPNLLPLESTNLDLSFEYYYDAGSYVSVGYFRKNVVNFISNTDIVTFIDGIYDPQNGARAAEARANGADSNIAIRDYILTNSASDPFVDAANGIITGDPSSDPLMEFAINTPINNDEERVVDGFEFNVQHFFGNSGFGVIANYTAVDSDLEYDNLLLEDQAAIIGLSDTANLVGIYEDHGFSVRLAYNWRDKYLSSRGQGTGANPEYQEDYNQFDLNIGYEVPQVDGLRVFVEALNITNEYTRRHGRSSYQVLNVTQTGARYNLGVAYKF